jgi:nucleoside-diphosphate-sugar epimerase
MNNSVLVTGSDGFIGSLLVLKLKSKGYNVVEWDEKNGDISITPIELKEINHVFHLAAQTFVPRSWDEPYSFYKSNTLGTVNVLEFCKNNGISLTHISAYVYGAPNSLPIDESHELKPSNPYMHSKILAESVCKFYSENFDVKVNIIRPFNIYGPGQSDRFLIPEIILQTLSKSEEIKVQDLSPKRDFVYIDDLIDAIILSLNTEGNYNVLNIGSGESFSVKEIIDLIQKIANTHKTVISNDNVRKNEIPDVVADISFAKEKLNWSPKFNLEDGLKKLVEYYKNLN